MNCAFYFSKANLKLNQTKKLVGCLPIVWRPYVRYPFLQPLEDATAAFSLPNVIKCKSNTHTIISRIACTVCKDEMRSLTHFLLVLPNVWLRTIHVESVCTYHGLIWSDESRRIIFAQTRAIRRDARVVLAAGRWDHDLSMQWFLTRPFPSTNTPFWLLDQQ